MVDAATVLYRRDGRATAAVSVGVADRSCAVPDALEFPILGGVRRSRAGDVSAGVVRSGGLSAVDLAEISSCSAQEQKSRLEC